MLHLLRYVRGMDIVGCPGARYPAVAGPQGQSADEQAEPARYRSALEPSAQGRGRQPPFLCILLKLHSLLHFFPSQSISIGKSRPFSLTTLFGVRGLLRELTYGGEMNANSVFLAVASLFDARSSSVLDCIRK